MEPGKTYRDTRTGKDGEYRGADKTALPGHVLLWRGSRPFYAAIDDIEEA